ncbi:hypothetical protein VKT23_020587 [Stygiomarasmius scandens]|uniref:SH3 domain-containing protein n=1 Tax=Marasmiellus scandens TaxID=2682957 RepID=A0ABR1IKK5_9AGAR
MAACSYETIAWVIRTQQITGGSGSGSRTNGYASASGSGSSSGYAATPGSGAESGGGYSSSPTSTYSQHTNTSTASTPSTTSTIFTNSQGSTAAPSSPLSDPMGGIVTHVKALHSFQPTEPELPFDKGDIIKVVDRGYRDWWRGQLRGRTGIFPVNYVEPLPEPTSVALAREAEAEAAVFAQAINVEKLLTLLRGFDSTKRSLADDEEIQEYGPQTKDCKVD